MTLDDYLALPYEAWVVPDVEEGGYVAGVSELPGCLTCAETEEEALCLLEDAKACWIGEALALGRDVPVPGR